MTRSFATMKTALSFFALLPALLAMAFMTGCGEAAPEPWRPGTPLGGDSVIIGIIYVDNAESGYSYAHDSGLREAQKELGLRDDQIIRKFDINDTDAIMVEAAMRQAIAEGANIIVATSWGHMDACEKLADIYPGVVFAHASGYKSNDANFANYFGRIYQARYLSGVAAGMGTRTNKIGFVAAQDKSNSEVTGGLNAFAMGVESVNPDAEIYVIVTYSWFDPAGERQAAQRLIAEGCDIIAQHCDTPNPQIEAERAGVWGIGYNSDMRREAPGAVLTSVIWNWGVYYSSMIRSIIDGTFTTEPYFAGLKEGLVDIAPLHGALATPEMEAAVAEARERILKGFDVFEGIIQTNDGLMVGKEGESLSDAEITGGINWYYRNITEIK
ncbi:MAG: BMP family ABC transporter substrate-binding protein [Deltaproteobacteria bacterium]|nr:BMP family ABC transporter substrate-binding protein [Deltaproteobacteria bacterium]